MAWPVAARTSSGLARRITLLPRRSASSLTSTRCRPLVITSNGLSSAMNTRLLAIAPTSHPSASAASAAVRVEAGNSRTRPRAPNASRASATRWLRSGSSSPPSMCSPFVPVAVQATPSRPGAHPRGVSGYGVDGILPSGAA